MSYTVIHADCFEWMTYQEEHSITAIVTDPPYGVKEYTEQEMESLLASCEFLIYEHIDHGEMTRRFFSAHNAACPARRMEVPKGVCYALAVREG